jgi:hypothetical protein
MLLAETMLVDPSGSNNKACKSQLMLLVALGSEALIATVLMVFHCPVGNPKRKV